MTLILMTEYIKRKQTMSKITDKDIQEQIRYAKETIATWPKWKQISLKEYAKSTRSTPRSIILDDVKDKK